MSSSYSFRCFIYLPSDVQKIVDGGSGGKVTPNVDRDIYKNQIEVKISDLRVRNGAGTDKGIIGMASKGFYNYYETADAKTFNRQSDITRALNTLSAIGECEDNDFEAVEI